MPYSRTLLAYKPFLVSLKDYSIRLPHAPEIVIPGRQTLRVGCGEDHEVPHEDCNCGLYTTMDLEQVQQYLCQPFLMNGPYVAFMGVWQVLGKTVIEDMTLRSWGLFLWGYVWPAKVNQSFIQQLHNKFNWKNDDNYSDEWFNLAIYPTLETSQKVV